MSKGRELTSAEDVSILSVGIKIEGNIFSEGNIRVDGKVSGDINVDGNLTLGEHAYIEGEVRAKNISVSGHIQGAVHVEEKIVFDSRSNFNGDLSTKILVIEAGAKFNGNSKMEQGTPTPKFDGKMFSQPQSKSQTQNGKLDLS